MFFWQTTTSGVWITKEMIQNIPALYVILVSDIYIVILKYYSRVVSKMIPSSSKMRGKWKGKIEEKEEMEIFWKQWECCPFYLVLQIRIFIIVYETFWQ